MTQSERPVHCSIEERSSKVFESERTEDLAALLVLTALWGVRV